VLHVYAVHAAPQEVVPTAKVHPAPGLSSDELARQLDEIDLSLRRELPEIAEVFIDITAHLRAPQTEDLASASIVPGS
jgi:hypothetical protein